MRAFLMAAVAAAALMAGAASATAAPIYTETFEDGVADGFTGFTSVATDGFGGRFLGFMTNEATGVLTLDLTGYTNTQLQFDVYALHSLDGPVDNFVVQQDSTTLLDAWFQHPNTHSFPSAPIATNTLGLGCYFSCDNTFRVTVNVASGGLTTFRFIGSTDQGWGDEAYGLDNVFVTGSLTQSAAPEPAAWALMIGGFGLAGATLRRRRTARAVA